MTQFSKNCSTCNTQFEDDISLNIHNFRKHGVLIPVFKCKLCSKIFPRKTALKEHKLKSHNQIQEHSSEVTKHTSRTLQHQSEANANELSNIYKDVSQECEFCGKTFDSKNLLKEHYESAHKNYLIARQKVEGKNKQKVSIHCDICEKSFLKIHYLNIRGGQTSEK